MLFESEEDEIILVATLTSYTNTDDELIDRIDPGCFTGARMTIWETARHLRAAGKTITRRAIAAEHADNQTIQAHLEQVSGRTWSGARIHEAERAVVELRQLRLLQGALTAAQERLGHSTYSEALEAAHGELSRLETASQDSSDIVEFSNVVELWQNDLNTRPETGQPIPTPWEHLDDKLNGGLHRGRTYVIGARPGEGKALALDTPIATPAGWTTMGDLNAGDQVYDENGRPVNVTYTTGVQLDRPCYRVTFSDGSHIVADAEHEWYTETRASRRSNVSEPGAIRTTREIASTIRTGSDHRLNHSIPVAGTLSGTAPIPMPAYTLGAWLGDGNTHNGAVTLNSDDANHILDRIAGDGYTYRAVPSCTFDTSTLYRIEGLTSTLRELDLAGRKHIPDAYFRAPLSDRVALLHGLMDTDGYCSTGGRIELCLTSKQLAHDAHALILTLGVQAFIVESDATLNGRIIGSRWRIRFTAPFPAFSLPRKADRQNTTVRPTTRRRYITSVEEVPSVPVKCIEVDNESHLYLAGESLVPTHNSIIGVNLATYAAQTGHPTLVFSVEMGKLEVASRVIAGGSHADYGQITRKDVDAYNWDRIAGWLNTNHEMPLGIIDKTDIGAEYVAAKCRTRKRTHGLDIVFVDYLQLLRAGSTKEARERQIAEMSRSLKVLAQELNIAVIIACQLNRNSTNEKRAPKLSDLRESGSIEQDCDVAMLLHHHMLDDGTHSGDVDLVIAKNRTGSIGTVRLRWKAYEARLSS